MWYSTIQNTLLEHARIEVYYKIHLDTDQGKMSKMTCSVENFIEIFSPQSYNVYSHSSQNSHTEVWCQVTHIINTQQNIYNANTDDNI